MGHYDSCHPLDESELRELVKKQQAQINGLKKLIVRGLDLCAVGRRLDGLMNDSKGGSMTPHAWAQEHYEKDLAQWEDDAFKAVKK